MERTRDYCIGYDKYSDGKVALRIRNTASENVNLYVKVRYENDVSLYLDICNYVVLEYALASEYGNTESKSNEDIKLMIAVSYYTQDGEFKCEILPYDNMHLIDNIYEEYNVTIGTTLKTMLIGALDSSIPQNYISNIEFSNIDNRNNIAHALEEYYKNDETILCHLV